MPRRDDHSKARILAVSAGQILARGARSVTLESVAREAGCAKGLVTYHFSGRDQLLASAGGQIFSGREASWRRAGDGATIETFIARSGDLITAEVNNGFQRAWPSLIAEGTELTVRTVNQHRESFAGVIGRVLGNLLADQGLEPTVGADELGRMLTAGLQGLGVELSGTSDGGWFDGAHSALWASVLSLTQPVRRRR